MNKEEIKATIKDCVYSEDGITYMSDKQYNNYIDIIEQLQQENKRYKEVINKAIKLIEDSYYSKNTTDIDSIVVSGDKLLQVRKILNEVE